MAKTTAEKEAELKKKKDLKKQEIERFSTGCTVLDCIFSEGRGSKEMGYPLGKVMALYSESKAGKTRLALEAIYSLLKFFGVENVEVLYLDSESGMSIDTSSCYGYTLKEGVSIKQIKTVEDFQVESHLFMTKKNHKKIGIIVTDSVDSLATAATLSNLEERVKQHKTKEDIEAIKSYNMDKPKLLSEIMPILVSEAAKYNTFVLPIQQVRENINAGPFGKKTRVSGGKAIGFYSSIVLGLRRADTFGKKDRETGYMLEILGEKTRTKYQMRKAYIAVDHLSGFDGVKSDLIFLYDLVTDTTKFDEKKAEALKWYSEWDNKLASEPVESVTNEQYKEFGEKYELREKVTLDGKKYTVGNIKKYISDDPETKALFISEYNVMNLDTLCEYIEQNDLEEELRNRVIDKFFTIEEGLRKVNRKKKGL